MLFDVALSALASLFISISELGLFDLDCRDRKRSAMIVSVSDDDDEAESSFSLDGGCSGRLR